MPVEVECGRCGRKYILSGDLEGARARCVQCNSLMEIVHKAASIDRNANHRSRRWRKALVVFSAVMGILALSLAVAAALVLPDARNTIISSRRQNCHLNMRRLALALLDYAHRHDGFTPLHPDGELSSLSLLYPEYVDNPNVFVCPAAPPEFIRTFPESSTLSGYRCSYSYNHYSNQELLSENAIMLSEPGGFHGEPGGHAIMMDGRIEWIVPEEVSR